MKKLSIIALCIIMTVTTALSQNISRSEGIKVARNIISERFASMDKNPDNYKISSSYTETFEGIEVFHVYNLSPEGFIIISASKSIEPILAFSYESSCGTTDRHPAVDAVLKSYSAQIAYAVKNNISASSHTSAEWQHYTQNDFDAREVQTVAPLLITKWNQGKYFNTMCPEDSHGPDGHVVVGCVATALAQIFNYFRYPSQGSGSYGYDHADYGHLEVNFAEQTYDYDYMPVKPTEYNDNMARLIYNIGVSVDMEYNPGGSGMTNHKGAYTMYTYFGYSDQAHYIFKDSLPTIIPESVENDTVIPDSIWNGILVDHLNRNIPLYYAGWGDYEYQSGHAFVFDGYNDSTHYHINWGWGGSYDGFFTISNLSPGGSNFRLAHEVIINAVPENENISCDGLKTINSLEGTLEDGSGPLHEYAAGSDCSWLIYAQDSIKGYTLEFKKFDIDESDYIIIYDGDSEDAPILASIYGDEEPEASYTTTALSVLVKFVSDENVSGDGWLLSYKANKPKYCKTLETLTATTDTITDGSDRWEYLNDTECRWKIRPSQTSGITIEFLELDTEYGQDFVSILRNGTSYMEFSGDTLPGPIHFDADNATILFKTNSSVRGQGFKLVYSIGETATEIHSIDDVSIYPNPANSIIHIIGNNLSQVSIYDITGRCLIEQEINGDNAEINASILPQGNYVARIIDCNGNLTNKKIEIVK